MADRKSVAKRAYVMPDGEKQRSASKDAEALTFEFSNGHELTVHLADFPEEVQVCAAWHGLNQKIGDAFAGAKGDADEAVSDAEDMISALKSGRWVAEREKAGPRVGMVAQAIYNAKTNAGMEADLDSITEKLQSNDEARKAALNDPRIKAEYEALKAEAAQERAKKAAEKAAEAEGEESLEAF